MRRCEGLSALRVVADAVIQTGYLRHYIMFTIGFTTPAVGGTMVFREALTAPSVPAMLRCCLYRLGAVPDRAGGDGGGRAGGVAAGGDPALGVVGFGIALIFLLFGAPDLAMTQFLVETLVVIILALVLARLPRLPPSRPADRRSAVRDGVIAVAFGAVRRRP